MRLKATMGEREQLYCAKDLVLEIRDDLVSKHGETDDVESPIRDLEAVIVYIDCAISKLEVDE